VESSSGILDYKVAYDIAKSIALPRA